MELLNKYGTHGLESSQYVPLEKPLEEWQNLKLPKDSEVVKKEVTHHVFDHIEDFLNEWDEVNDEYNTLLRFFFNQENEEAPVIFKVLIAQPAKFRILSFDILLKDDDAEKVENYLKKRAKRTKEFWGPFMELPKYEDENGEG